MDFKDYEKHGRDGSHVWWYRVKQEIVSSFIEQAAAGKNGPLDILEVGCGTGGNLRHFRRFGRVIGIDSDPRLKIFFKKNKREFRLGRAENLPFPASSFDCVVASDVLEHVEEDSEAVKQIRRVLRPGGLAVVTVPAFQALFGPSDKHLGHLRRYNPAGLSALFDGFEIAYLGYWNSLLFLPAAALKLFKKAVRAQPSTDLHNLNPFLNELLYQISAFETRIIASGRRLPFGTSLLCVAKKCRERKGDKRRAKADLFHL